MKNPAIQMDPATAAQVCGTVFDIERFSVHDGRGIRTVVFFEGLSAQMRMVRKPGE